MYSTIMTTALVAALSTVTAAQNANTSADPLHFGILLIPSVQPIDLYGPLDVLTGLQMWYPNITGKMSLSMLSVNSTPATTSPPMAGIDFGAPILPTITLDQYRQLKAKNFTGDIKDSNCNDTTIKNKGPLDVIIVPGGGGTRADVTKEIAFLKEEYPSLKHIISVCTGSTLLARAGILDNKKATTNKKAWAWATTFGKNVKYQPKARWVQDGNVWTGSGVSAAVDTTYAWVSSVYGEKVATFVADAAEYTRWTNASYDPFADRWGIA